MAGKNFVKKPKSIAGQMLLAYMIGTIIILIVHYIFPTPWNIHSIECWWKCIFILGVYSILNFLFLSGGFLTKTITSQKKAKLVFLPFLAPYLQWSYLRLSSLRVLQLLSAPLVPTFCLTFFQPFLEFSLGFLYLFFCKIVSP